MFRMLLSALATLVLTCRGAGNEPTKAAAAGRMKAEWCELTIRDGKLSGHVHVVAYDTFATRVVKDGKVETRTFEVPVKKLRPFSWERPLDEIVALDSGELVDSSNLTRLLKKPQRVLLITGTDVNLKILKPIQHLVLILPTPK